MNTEHCVSVCNGLLRGERSAVETYEKVISTFDHPPAELEEMLGDHQEAINALIENVRFMGGEPETTAGAWGVVASTVQSTADAVGPNTALSSLKAGEKSGLSDYERALEDEGVMDACKTLIRSDLIPMVRCHIEALDTLISAG